MMVFGVIIALLYFVYWLLLSTPKKESNVKVHVPNARDMQVIEFATLANRNVENGDIREAIYNYNRAISLDPSTPVYYINRAYCKIEIKDFEGAIEDSNTAISLEKFRHRAYYNRGVAYFFLGNLDQACDDWSLAAKDGSKDAVEMLRLHYKPKPYVASDRQFDDLPF